MSGDIQFIAAADMDIRKLKCGRSKSGRVKREYADFDPRSTDFKDPLTRSKRVKEGCEKLYVSLQQSKAQHSTFTSLWCLRAQKNQPEK